MGELAKIEAMQTEHQAWLDLCMMLKDTKAVTMEDLQSRVSINDTPGQVLLNSIRFWGETLVELKGAEVEENLRTNLFPSAGKERRNL